MPLYYCCSIMFIFLVGFAWNKHQEDQSAKPLIAVDLSETVNVTVHTKTEAKPCVGFLV